MSNKETWQDTTTRSNQRGQSPVSRASLHDADEEILLAALQQARREFEHTDSSEGMLDKQRNTIGQALASRGDIWEIDEELVLHHPRLGDTHIPIRELPCSVGSSDQADVVLPLQEISGMHCRLEQVGLLVRVTVHGMSTHRTYLNNQEIQVGDLRVGDKLRLGEHTFTVVRNEAAGRIRTTQARGEHDENQD